MVKKNRSIRRRSVRGGGWFSDDTAAGPEIAPAAPPATPATPSPGVPTSSSWNPFTSTSSSSSTSWNPFSSGSGSDPKAEIEKNTKAIAELEQKNIELSQSVDSQKGGKRSRRRRSRRSKRSRKH